MYDAIVILGPTACGKTSLGVGIAAALNGEIAHEQAALEICDSDRPIKRAVQGKALCAVNFVLRDRQQTAVHSAYRRHRIGHKFAQEIRRVRLHSVKELRLVDIVGS